MGGGMAKIAFCDPFTSSHLSIGEFGWSLERRLFGVCIAKIEGSTAEVSGAKVGSASYSVHVSYDYYLELLTNIEQEPIKFGFSRFDQELRCVEFEIDNHIRYLKAKSKVEACIASANDSVEP
jgi:hypothetical protein